MEDGSGVAVGVVGVVPFVGSALTPVAGALFAAPRRREQEKYKGLRVLRCQAPGRDRAAPPYNHGMPKKLILAVIDGLGPELLDRTIAGGRAPNLARLQQLGTRTDACVSTFPSLTPVCLSALITGAHPEGSGSPA